MCKLEKKEKINRLCSLFFYLSCFIFVLSITGRVYFFNDLAVKNRDLKNSYDRQVALEEEISRLKYEDSRVSSASFIEQKALKMGFMPMNKPLVSIETTLSDRVASLSR